MHVFVLLPEEEENWKVSEKPEEWLEDEKFAGSGAIFGGKGKECKNCVERDPYNVLVDISDALYARSQPCASEAASPCVHPTCAGQAHG